jgi:undecaprenyl-diphosphatase
VPTPIAASDDAISTFEAIVLGIVQGLTEFLPISSTAHLRVVPAFAGWGDPGAAFTAVVQLGTMAAVLLYFRYDLWRMARAFVRTLGGDRPLWRTDEIDGKLGWYIVLGTIPISIAGLALKDVVDDEFRTLELIAIVMILFSFVLHVADTRGSRTREVSELTLSDGLKIGAAQALALVPGVSRSGATISAALLLGLTREAATRYSFLLSVPAIVLAGLFEMRKVAGGEVDVAPTIVATVFAFISGYAAIAWLLRYVRTHDFSWFVRYRLAVGVLVLVLAVAGSIA